MKKTFRVLDSQVGYISIPDGSGGIENVEVSLSNNAVAVFENRATHVITNAETTNKYKLDVGDYTVRVKKKETHPDAVYSDLTTKSVTCFRDQLPFIEEFEVVIDQQVRVTGKNDAVKAVIFNSTKRVPCLVNSSVLLEKGKWKVQVDGALPNALNPQIIVHD